MAQEKPVCGARDDGQHQEYDLLLHVLGLFLVLFASCLGAGFPMAAQRIRWMKVPPKVFFACKHFGTGVLIATAFVHLLPTAFGSLGDPCLPDLFTKDYPPLPGVIMMGSLFILFVVEMWLNAKTGGHSHGGPLGNMQDHAAGHDHAAHDHASHDHAAQSNTAAPPMGMHSQGFESSETLPVQRVTTELWIEKPYRSDDDEQATESSTPAWFAAFHERYVRQRDELAGVDVLSQKEDRKVVEEAPKTLSTATVKDVTVAHDEEAAVDPDVFRKMSTNIALLEGGILFHSVFVGMTVSITIDGFVILLVAILFHQMFEGLGLGTRIAAVPYPKGSWKPWFLVVAFGTTAPIGQAIGLVARNSYDPSSAFGLIVVGVFNAISSGLLIYAALVNLLAEDFLSAEANRLLSRKGKIAAFCWVLLGACGMSVVGAFA